MAYVQDLLVGCVLGLAPMACSLTVDSDGLSSGDDAARVRLPPPLDSSGDAALSEAPDTPSLFGDDDTEPGGGEALGDSGLSVVDPSTPDEVGPAGPCEGPPACGSNLLINASFDDGMAGWAEHSEIAATTLVVNEPFTGLRASIDEVGAVYQYQVFQQHIMSLGQEYVARMDFRAIFEGEENADAGAGDGGALIEAGASVDDGGAGEEEPLVGRAIQLEILESGGVYTAFAVSGVADNPPCVVTNAEWVTCEVTGTITLPDVAVKIGVEAGNSPVDFYMDNASLVRIR